MHFIIKLQFYGPMAFVTIKSLLTYLLTKIMYFVHPVAYLGIQKGVQMFAGH